MSARVELARWVALYWAVVFPRTARELRRWRRRAQRIPDPALRELALGKLERERLHADGAAAFAILAARRHRADVLAACVAFEVLYDYLDALTEAHPTLDNNRRLHRALPDAFAARPVAADYYAHHPQTADDGYLAGLVDRCRDAFARLPGDGAARAELVLAAERAGESQSLNHADPDARAAWAATLHDGPAELPWWELTAAAASPLGIFALVAAAGRPGAGAAEAQAIAGAYFPWVGALDWLMENLVDRAADARSGEANYVSLYASDEQATRHLAALAAWAATVVRRLPQGQRHGLMLAGMVALHVSHVDDGDAAADATARAVRQAVGDLVAPFLWVLWLRRLIGRRRLRGADAAPAPEPAGRRDPRAAARR